MGYERCDKNGINETGYFGIGVIVLYRADKKKLSIKRAYFSCQTIIWDSNVILFKDKII